jgi:hypothetical protein
MASAACALPASKSIAVGSDGRAYMMHAGQALALKAAGDPNLELSGRASVHHNGQGAGKA